MSWLSVFRIVVFAWLHSSLRVDGAITSASVTPLSLVAGATGDADIAFTTGLGIPINGKITVVFPPTFYLTSTLYRANPVGIDTSSSLSLGPNSYSVVITIAGTAVAAGTSVAFTIDGVTNPGDGTTSSYIIRTGDTTGNTVESLSSIPGSVITKTAFADATLAASTTDAGAAVQFTASFTTTSLLRIGSLIEVEFPVLAASTFVVSSATVAARTGLHTSSSVTSTALPYLRVSVAGQDLSANTYVSVTIGSIFNPAAQTLGTFAIRTRQSGGAIYQETTGLSIGNIQATPLASTATIKPPSFFAGIMTTYAVSFSNAAYLSTGSRIVVTFPARFQISAATLSATNNLPSTGTTLAAISTTQVQVSLGAGAVQAGSNRGFTIANIINPGSSCSQYIYEYCSPWEDFGIVITDGIGQIFEQSTNVPGIPIVKKPMAFARVRPLLKVPQQLTSVTVSFTSGVIIPVGGKIEVVFPTGYTIGAGVAASGHTGIPAASTTITIVDQQVSVTVAGASISPSTGLAITFSDITTPDSTATGMYIVRTKDPQNAILEEQDHVNGEGCASLNDCNGHGTCTLFSQTCICDSGWGSSADIAAYKSPDCTLRVCPHGTSWNSVPIDENIGHSIDEECSGMGVCDRASGKCACFTGFEGNACQRMTCPNNCRGHGRCVSMRELAGTKNGFPLSAAAKYTGLMSSTTWDEGMVFGCVCDSSWSVGTGAGEVQVTEYFGGDCSRRHCPTGNDPETDQDETDCSLVGSAGNLCFVECSNRGICNYKYGTCQCFPGFSGYACQIKDVLSK